MIYDQLQIRGVTTGISSMVGRVANVATAVSVSFTSQQDKKTPFPRGGGSSERNQRNYCEFRRTWVT